MGGLAIFRVIFAFLALFWDLTDARSVDASYLPAAEQSCLHSLSDVVPIALRHRQEALTQAVFLPFICPSIACLGVARTNFDLAWLDVGGANPVPAGGKLLYSLMSLQR
jgi:hypothetical protein